MYMYVVYVQLVVCYYHSHSNIYENNRCYSTHFVLIITKNLLIFEKSPHVIFSSLGGGDSPSRLLNIALHVPINLDAVTILCSYIMFSTLHSMVFYDCSYHFETKLGNMLSDGWFADFIP